MEAALPVQPCGILQYKEDRRVDSYFFPGRPDPASSPERCTFAWRQHYPVVRAGRSSKGGGRCVDPLFLRDPDPASSPERCTLRGGSITRATVLDTSSVKDGTCVSTSSTSRETGPRLLAGAMHVAWRRRYPGDRAGYCREGWTSVSTPYSRKTGPRLLA